MDYLTEVKKKFSRFRVKKSFKESIEPEEIFIDAQKSFQFPEQKIEVPLKNKVFIIFFGFVLAGLLILFFQAGYFQIFKNKSYAKLAKNNSIRAFPILAPRGLIFDKFSMPLVNNLPVFNVFISPQDLPKEKQEREAMLEQISFFLELDPRVVNQEIEQFDFEKEQRILLVSDLAPEKFLEIESRIGNFPVLTIEQSVIRQYPYGESLSHVIGYTGRLTKDDLNKLPDYVTTERIGKSGLEIEFENILKGKTGNQRIEVDSRGRQIQDLGTEKEIPGQGIITTIDLGLQQKIFSELSAVVKNLKLSRGAAVAVDPRNGQVLGLVSLPSFDSNFFEQSFYTEQRNKIFEDQNWPLFNRVISGQYAPGSTIKPIIGVAALQEKVVIPAITIFDPGQITVVNQYDPSIIYVYPDWKAHGIVDIYSAIAQSCDVYFYTVGGGYGNINGLGIERIAKYLKLFGFGAQTGINLPGEAAGLVPDSDWKEEVKKEQWFLGDTYHVSIGQGDLLVTPIQLVMAISAIANNGKLFKPYLIDKIVDSDKNSINTFSPQLVKENFIDSQYLDVIRKGMREAVVSGSARFLSDLPVKAAAKTGTAQFTGQANTNAWFVAFAPYDNSEIALVVMAENAGEGSSVAAPVAKEILKYYFTR